MAFLRHNITYEDAEGNEQKERFYTNDDSETNVRIDGDGDIIVADQFEDVGQYVVFYVPKHRLVCTVTEVIEEKI